MPTYLVVHTRYTDVEIGLFRAQNMLESIKQESKLVSSCFTADLTTLLKKNNIKLQELDFIAAHNGPAPFTTLRVSLALLNGIAFTHKVQLIGIDGLRAFTFEHSSNNCTYTLALLNAFCNDIYYGLYKPETNSFHHGYAPADRFLEETVQNISGTVNFIGNGVKLHKEKIISSFGSRAIIPEELPEIASLEAIAFQALAKWNEKKPTQYEIVPNYLKSAEPI